MASKVQRDSLAELQGLVVKFCQDRDWDQFHAPKNVAMALAIEAAEVMEPMRWMSEKDSWELETEVLRQVQEEIGDVMFCLLNLCHRLKVDPIAACRSKIEASAKKYPVESARGSSQKYPGAR